jgi:hypothetical protein
LITSNRIGDIAEFLFDAKAVELGYVVTRPIHAGTVYDRVIDNGERFFRVQIKCIWDAISRGGKYRVFTRRTDDSSYSRRDVDVIAAYIKNENSWYLFINKSAKSITIKDTFKENWKIFETVQGHKEETPEGLGLRSDGL